MAVMPPPMSARFQGALANTSAIEHMKVCAIAIRPLLAVRPPDPVSAFGFNKDGTYNTN